MERITTEEIAVLKREYPVGCRVKLVEMDDVQAPPVGTEGVVTGIDGIGSLCVDWDNGSHLHILYGVDIVEKI